ncbi:sensor histidine kinase [Brevifollis gellanilyticus]|nr:HAMP domain-containing sensor histidine kinase [Brevifollis gellanilyticus]
MTAHLFSPMQFVFPTHLQLANEQSDGFHQELLRGLTHKLNNLLAVIQGFSSLILMTDDLDANIAENMQHIREASVGVSNLSERVRGAGGCAKLQMQALNLNEYLGVVQTALLEPFTKSNVQLDADVQQSLPAINVDPGKLKDILVEILKNAAEAAAPVGGRAMLKIAGPGAITPAEQRRVDILVSNTGSTITPEKLQQVFRAFYGSKTSNHLGLGLTISSMLCHQMGVQIGIASENNTTTVWLSCPMA